MEKFITLVLIIVVVACLQALPVMWLWNWLVPDLFGLPTIDFLQALGLTMLCSFLFKDNWSYDD